MKFNIKESLKLLDEVMNGISTLFHTLSFWFLLIFLLGFLSGTYAMNKYLDVRMNDAVKLNGIIINGLPFDLKQRP